MLRILKLVEIQEPVIKETKLQPKKSRGCGNRCFAISANYTGNQLRELQNLNNNEKRVIK